MGGPHEGYLSLSTALNIDLQQLGDKGARILIIIDRQYDIQSYREFGSLARHSWGTVEAQLGHKIENSRAQLGHSLSTVGT